MDPIFCDIFDDYISSRPPIEGQHYFVCATLDQDRILQVVPSQLPRHYIWIPCARPEFIDFLPNSNPHKPVSL